MFPRTLLCLVAENESLDDGRRAVEIARDAKNRLSFAVVGVALPPPASIYYAVPMEAWSDERDEGLKAVKAKARRARYADLTLLFDEANHGLRKKALPACCSRAGCR